LAPETRRELEQAERSPCEEALAGIDLPALHETVVTERFGHHAQVRFDADTAFLAEYDDGWKVIAAGCTARDPLPYDCVIETDEQQRLGEYVTPASPRWAAVGGLRTRLYSHSLGMVMGTIFVASWTAQSIAGWATSNEERIGRLLDPIGWTEYVRSADFWSRSLQNWQSEFLAIGSMVVLSLYLRERGSPESKPVGSAHDATGVEG
jgi:hypothetical protein